MTEAHKSDKPDVAVHHLQQEIEALRHKNKNLINRLEALEGAAVAAFEDKVTHLEQGDGAEVMKQYHDFLERKFTKSVITELFESNTFAENIGQYLKRYFLTIRGIFTILGIGVLSTFGLNTIIERTAESEFQDRIEAEYPELVERLERDRETIMLLTLDISAQDQNDFSIPGSSVLDIDPIREAYLENNSDYEKIIVEFLKAENESPLQEKILRKDGQNKAILRHYALKYILRVDSNRAINKGLWSVLRDTNIPQPWNMTSLDSSGESIDKIDAHNQILAIRALRRDRNFLPRLAKNILMDDDYNYLYRNNIFWRGFFNELLFIPLKRNSDIDSIQQSLESPWIGAEENRKPLANTLLLLFTLYPKLCGGTCASQLSPLIETLNPKYANGYSESVAQSTAQQVQPAIDECDKYLNKPNVELLLKYRTEETSLTTIDEFSKASRALHCILVEYYEESSNFSFYQEPLFHSEYESGVSFLHKTYIDLTWEWFINSDYREPLKEGDQASSDNFFPEPYRDESGSSPLNRLIEAMYFYPRSTYQQTQPQGSFDPYAYGIAPNNPQAIYEQTIYETWVVAEISKRIREDERTEQAFTQIVEGSEQPMDIWSLQNFLENLRWNQAIEQYQNKYEYSASRLVEGEGIEDYLNVMSSGYYPRAFWAEKIYPLFEERWTGVIAWDRQQNTNYFDGNEGPASKPTGLEAEQDALWQWVTYHYYESNGLFFDANKKQWQPQQRSTSES